MFYHPFGYYHSTQTSTQSKSLSSSSSSTTVSAQFPQRNLNNLPNHLMNNVEFNQFNPYYQNQYQNGYQAHDRSPFFSTQNAQFCNQNLNQNVPFKDEFQQYFYPEFQTNSFNNIWKPLNVSTRAPNHELMEKRNQTKSTSDSSSTRSESYCSPNSISALSPRAITKIHSPYLTSQDGSGCYEKFTSKSNYNQIRCDTDTDDTKYCKSLKNDKQYKNHSSMRNLPVRSQNIDLSSYLNQKKCESPSMSPLSNPISPNSSISGPSSPFSSGAKSHSPAFKTSMECSFCKTNGEKKEIYSSHNLKDSLGKLICPVLREFKCPKCGESGDYAHTNKYCPVTQRKKKENKIKKLTLIN